GDPAGAGQFEDAVGPHQFDEGFDLVFLAGDLDHEAAGTDIDDPATEHLHEQGEFDSLGGGGLDLEKHEVAFDEVLGADVHDLDDGDDLVELLANLIEDRVIALDDEGHAREVGVLGFANREAVDVEAA